jgi:hypothetical protein
MKTKTLLIIAGLFFLSFNGCGLLGKKYTKTESSEHRISTVNKKKIYLENVNGNINVVKSSEESVLIIKAVKETRVRKKDLDTPLNEIKIDIDTSGDNINVKTDFNRNTGIKFFNFGKNPRVDYDIFVPSGIDVEIENVNGDFNAKKLNNKLKISLVNGNADVERYTGNLDCEITNGSFSGEIDSTGGMDISIVNGSITLNLNGYINANISAETVNGKITDDNLQMNDVRKEKKSLKGKLGNTETDVDIKIETVNGKIKLIGKNVI